MPMNVQSEVLKFVQVYNFGYLTVMTGVAVQILAFHMK